mmetsp:Transcript_25690/g.60220  ORF Transcript_25690/g.60220 Transcript_25690/m.60220 type:complete len:530 (-) Transcript_25690:178-1767(-)
MRTGRVTVIMSTLLTTAAGWITRRQLFAWGPRVVSSSSSSSSPPPSLPTLAARATARSFSSGTGSDSLGSDAGAAAAAAVEEERVGGDRHGPTALVFDTETTGMVQFRDSHRDESQPDLVQLGFLMVDTGDWRIRDQGCFLVRLRESSSGIDEGAEKVHGITADDCASFGIRHETAVDLFEDLCGKADVLVGHNIRFDALVMQTAFHRAKGSPSENPFSSKRQICTMMESIDLCRLPPKFSSRRNNSTAYKWPSLEEAHRFVTTGGDCRDGESLEGAHDALVDSQACLKIFRYLVEHGHVTVDKSPVESYDATATATASESSNPSVTVSEADHPAGASGDLFPDIENGNEDRDALESNGIIDEETATHDYDTGDRNAGIDRSREVEEAAALSYDDDFPERNGGVDRSMQIEDAAVRDSDTIEDDSGVHLFASKAEEAGGGTARLFDPAAFSPNMLENDSNARTGHFDDRKDSAGEAFRVSGNTYKHKEMIKQMGGRWNAESREWVFRENRYLSKLETYTDLTIVRSSVE